MCNPLKFLHDSSSRVLAWPAVLVTLRSGQSCAVLMPNRCLLLGKHPMLQAVQHLAQVKLGAREGVHTRNLRTFLCRAASAAIEAV